VHSTAASRVGRLRNRGEAKRQSWANRGIARRPRLQPGALSAADPDGRSPPTLATHKHTAAPPTFLALAGIAARLWITAHSRRVPGLSLATVPGLAGPRHAGQATAPLRKLRAPLVIRAPQGSERHLTPGSGGEQQHLRGRVPYTALCDSRREELTDVGVVFAINPRLATWTVWWQMRARRSWPEADKHCGAGRRASGRSRRQTCRAPPEADGREPNE
jgi:hypothetical protein